MGSYPEAARPVSDPDRNASLLRYHAALARIQDLSDDAIVAVDHEQWIILFNQGAGLRKNGAEFPAEASIAKAIADGRNIFTAVMRDATERMPVVSDGGIGLPPELDWRGGCSQGLRLGLRLVLTLSEQLRARVALRAEGGSQLLLRLSVPFVRRT